MDITVGTMITSVASTVGVVLVAWIAYKTAQLNKKVDIVEKNTNGILEAQTKAKDRAEGAAEAAVEIAAKQPPAPPI